MNYRVLFLVALGHFIIDMHQGALPTILPRLQAEFALPYAMVGMLMLLMQVSSSVIQPLFGLLSDKVSTHWLLPVSGLVASAGYVLLLTGNTFTSAAIAIFVMGIGVAAFHPEGSKLAHFASGDRKAWSMSVFAIGGNVGVAAGSLFMGLMIVAFGLGGVAGFFAITIPAALVFTRAIPELYANVPGQRASGKDAGRSSDGAGPSSGLSGGAGERTPGSADEERSGGEGARQVRGNGTGHGRGHGLRAGLDNGAERTRSDFANMNALLLLIVVIVLRSFAHTSMSTFIPLYYDTHLGLGTRTASTLLTVYQAAGALGTMLGGWMADRWGRREVIIGTMLFALLLPKHRRAVAGTEVAS